MNKYNREQAAAKDQRRESKMCAGKKSFKTKAEAEQKGQRVYKCPICKKWHRSGQQAAFIAALKNKKPKIFIPRLKPGESYRPGTKFKR